MCVISETWRLYQNLCKCVILLISIMFIYTLEKLLRLPNFIIVNSLIVVIEVVWPIIVIFVPLPHHCCQFIPLCA